MAQGVNPLGLVSLQYMLCQTRSLFISLYFQIRYSKRKRETNWIKKPLDELEKIYDVQWLQEKVVKVQKGEPHPQDVQLQAKMHI